MKLISINIEGRKHFDTVIPFIKKENPDVVCMQEIIRESVPYFETELGMKGVFIPMVYDLIIHDGGLAGIALFSKHSLEDIRKEYYVGSEESIEHLPRLEHFEPGTFQLDSIHTYIHNAVLSGLVTVGEKSYRVATTHGIWTPEGASTEYQLKDFDKMIEILDNLGDFVFTGDLNAPRGNESFARLARKYKDNIPAEYKTSLDQNLHRVKGLQHMVDGLFTTPKYAASNVRLVDAISDHMAIVADIL